MQQKFSRGVTGAITSTMVLMNKLCNQSGWNRVPGFLVLVILAAGSSNAQSANISIEEVLVGLQEPLRKLVDFVKGKEEELVKAFTELFFPRTDASAGRETDLELLLKTFGGPSALPNGNSDAESIPVDKKIQKLRDLHLASTYNETAGNNERNGRELVKLITSRLRSKSVGDVNGGEEP